MSGWRDRVNQRDSRQIYQGKLSYGASLFHGFISAGLRQKPFRSQWEDSSSAAVIDAIFSIFCRIWSTIWQAQSSGWSTSPSGRGCWRERTRTTSGRWRIAYNACFRSVPIGLVLGIAVGFRLPAHPAVWLWTALSLCLAVYLGVLLFYLVGITSFWTTESAELTTSSCRLCSASADR